MNIVEGMIGLEPDRIVSSQDMFAELEKVEPQQAFPTGYYHFDNMTKGIKEGDLFILSGLTGNGKTEFAVSLAKRLIENETNVLFFSYEISSQELLERFGTPVPTFYLPRLATSKSTQWIEKKIKEAIAKYETKVVFIDHLHYLVDDSTTRTKNTSEMLGQLCRDFKQIARNNRVAIVLLCHVRKFTSTRPNLQDIKDSSGIIQEADTVLIIHRKGQKRSRRAAQDTEEEYEVSNEATLYIDKVRRRGGKIGKIDLVFEEAVYKEL